MTKNSPAILITSNLYRPNIGGVENSLHHLARSYLEMGYQPVIVTSNITPSKGIDVEDFEDIGGIHVYRYSTTKKVRAFGINIPSFFSSISNALRVYKIVKSTYNPKITITRYHYNQLLAYLAGIKNTVYLVPGVVRFQNSVKNAEISGVQGSLRRSYHIALQYLALLSADRVAVFSQNMLAQLNKVKKQKYTPLLTKPGVDETRFYPINKFDKLILRRKLALECNARVFLCVGRFVKAKGFDIVIESFAKLACKDSQLWLVGDGPLLKHYNSLIEKYNLESQVKILGSQPKPELYYRAADFFVMSSLYEPLGQTILEGMASGLPVLAFAPSQFVQTASYELMNEKQCTFVDAPNSNALGKKIDELNSWTPSQYDSMSKHCRRHVVESFTWNKLANDLYNQFNVEEKKPLVSVFVPTKNRLFLLKRALNSVMEQSYENIELIVIDDGSSDGTQEWLSSFSATHPRVKTYRFENSVGAPVARNKAIEIASGELITGLDDDDYFYPKRIGNLVAQYDPKYAFICSGFYWNYGRVEKKVFSSGKEITLEDQLHINCVSNYVLIERQRLIDIGGYDTDFVSCQDWDIWTRVIQKYGAALRTSNLDYVIDASHGHHRITDNPNRVKGFYQYLDKFKSSMTASHKKSLSFHIAVAKCHKINLLEALKIATLPLLERNLKYWLSCKFPSYVTRRIKRMK